MEITGKYYFLLFLSSFVIVSSITPVVRRIAIHLRIFDHPKASHKTHQIAVPYLGGVAIILGVLITTFSSIFISSFTLRFSSLVFSIFLPALILGLVGLVDDTLSLKPWPRFLVQSFTAAVSTFFLISNNQIGVSSGSKLFDYIISIFWIVGICNAINLFDNIDGGSAGAITITSLTIFILASSNGQFLVAALSVVTAGSTIGFLVWNKSPARIYMGDAGALFLGFLTAVLLLRLKLNVQSNSISLLTVIFLIALPIIDTSVVIISRLHRNISPFQGGQDHLSHRLLKRGYSKESTVLILWSLCAYFALHSLAIVRWHSYSQLIAIIGLMELIAVLILFLIIKPKAIYV